MKSILGTMLILLFAATTFAQLKVKATGEQSFKFTEDRGRNQASFFSSAPLESISGLTSDITGTITFNVADVKNSLKGEFRIPVASLKTGIDTRDEHLQGEGWLNASSYPDMVFTIKEVKEANLVEDNKMTVKTVGSFTLHGVTKEIETEVTMTYLDESEATKTRLPGDLLGVYSKFNIRLSDFNVKNDLLGNKVAEVIEITLSIVGSNQI